MGVVNFEKNMKTAIILTGQARTFRYTFPTLHWCLFRKLPNPHFFVSVADDAQAPDMDLLRERYEHVHIEYVKQPETIPEPEGNLDQRAGWFRSASVQSILKQLWALERGWDFFTERNKAECDKADPQGVRATTAKLHDFDLIVRCRPDLWCQDIRLPNLDPQSRLKADCPISSEVYPNECLTPWWGTFGGVNDRLALMGPLAAPHYFRAFSNREALWKLGCPLHPETMVRASLELGGVNVLQKLLAEFRICRMPDKTHAQPYLVQERQDGTQGPWPQDLVNLSLL